MFLSHPILGVSFANKELINTVKHAHVVTSIKQSPVLKDHLFLDLSQKILYELNLS
jgi:hypothetical protein